jgi:hypothetical protein
VPLFYRLIYERRLSEPRSSDELLAEVREVHRHPAREAQFRQAAEE